MLSYGLKYRKNTESKNPKVVKTKYGRIMLLSNFPVSNSKKLKFMKDQQPKVLLLSYLARVKIPILSDLPIINTFF